QRCRCGAYHRPKTRLQVIFPHKPLLFALSRTIVSCISGITLPSVMKHHCAMDPEIRWERRKSLSSREAVLRANDSDILAIELKVSEFCGVFEEGDDLFAVCLCERSYCNTPEDMLDVIDDSMNSETALPTLANDRNMFTMNSTTNTTLKKELLDCMRKKLLESKKSEKNDDSRYQSTQNRQLNTLATRHPEKDFNES
ncbi:hypothetical protein Y032_0912g3007, partial [Ancylostoma ceylanicum]